MPEIDNNNEESNFKKYSDVVKSMIHIFHMGTGHGGVVNTKFKFVKPGGTRSEWRPFSHFKLVKFWRSIKRSDREQTIHWFLRDVEAKGAPQWAFMVKMLASAQYYLFMTWGVYEATPQYPKLVEPEENIEKLICDWFDCFMKIKGAWFSRLQTTALDYPELVWSDLVPVSTEA